MQNFLYKHKYTKGMWPVFFIEAPSTKVSRLSRVIGFPSFKELYIDGDPYGSNPISFVSGDIWLKYEAKPEAKPPPPQQVKT